METVMLVSIMLIPTLMIIIWWNDITNNIGRLFRTVTNTITSSYNNTVERLKDRLLSVNWISNWYERYHTRKIIKPYEKEYTKEEWEVVNQLFLNQVKQFKGQEKTLPRIGATNTPLNIVSLEQVVRIANKVCHKLLETNDLFKIVPMVGPVGLLDIEGTDDSVTVEAMSKKTGRVEISQFQNELFIDEVEESLANEIHSKYLEHLFSHIGDQSNIKETVKYHNTLMLNDSDVTKITKASVGKGEILLNEIVPTIENLFTKYQYMGVDALVVNDYGIVSQITVSDNFTYTKKPDSNSHIRKIGQLKLSNGKRIDIYQDFAMVSKNNTNPTEGNMYMVRSESGFVSSEKNIPIVTNNCSAAIMPYVPLVCMGPIDTDGEPEIGMRTRFACVSFIDNIVPISLEVVEHTIENEQES